MPNYNRIGTSLNYRQPAMARATRMRYIPSSTHSNARRGIGEYLNRFKTQDQAKHNMLYTQMLANKLAKNSESLRKEHAPLFALVAQRKLEAEAKAKSKLNQNARLLEEARLVKEAEARLLEESKLVEEAQAKLPEESRLTKNNNNKSSSRSINRSLNSNRRKCINGVGCFSKYFFPGFPGFPGFPRFSRKNKRTPSINRQNIR